MSTGKYSPYCPNNDKDWNYFNRNSYGEFPVEYAKDTYDEKTMFADYDPDGFDSYGYSAFDHDGTYVGTGNGIDRLGYTEDDYLMDAVNGGNLYYDLQAGNSNVKQFFTRNR